MSTTWTAVDEKLINAYVTLVMGGRRTLEQVPEKYRAETELRVAEKTVTILERQ